MDYSKHYSEESWIRKIRNLPAKSATDLMDKAITLYALLKSSSTPAWTKAAIIAALGYFICPLDAVPDFLPVGFVYITESQMVQSGHRPFHRERLKMHIEVPLVIAHESYP